MCRGLPFPGRGWILRESVNGANIHQSLKGLAESVPEMDLPGEPAQKPYLRFRLNVLSLVLWGRESSGEGFYGRIALFSPKVFLREAH